MSVCCGGWGDGRAGGRGLAEGRARGGGSEGTT